MKLVVTLALLVSGCFATTKPPPSMGCTDVLADGCDDPTAYPPLTLMLPPWPFPKLLVPIPEPGMVETVR